jgi:hypothetical protein
MKLVLRVRGLRPPPLRGLGRHRHDGLQLLARPMCSMPAADQDTKSDAEPPPPPPPSSWDKPVFPTCDDIVMFVTHERYRWQPGGSEEDEARCIEFASQRVLEASGKPVGGSTEGPSTEDLLHYMAGGKWREAQLFDSLRPTPDELVTASAAFGLELSTVRDVAQQLRHTAANPMGAASHFATKAEGGPSGEALLKMLRAQSFDEFAACYPDADADSVRRSWEIINGHGEINDQTRDDMETVHRVVKLLETLGHSYPLFFGRPGSEPVQWSTEFVLGVIDELASKQADSPEAADFESLREMVRAKGVETWRPEELALALHSGGAAESAMDDVMDAMVEEGEDEKEEKDGDEGDDEAEEEEGWEEEDGEGETGGRVWREDIGGLAGNGYGSYVMGDGDFSKVDREEYARRLRHYVDRGIRGHVYLALDTLGISVQSFRDWLRTGEIPSEWGGSSLNESEEALHARVTDRTAALVTQLQRLIAVLRRTPQLVQKFAESQSWQSSMTTVSATGAEAIADRKKEKLFTALNWTADAIETSLTGDSGVGGKTVVTQAALDRIASCVGEEDAGGDDDNDDEWPASKGDESEAVLLPAILDIVEAIATDLGQGASSVRALSVELRSEFSQLDKARHWLKDKHTEVIAEQRQFGRSLAHVQAAIGEDIAQFAHRRRQEYFEALAAVRHASSVCLG